ncbi:hypothetical protein, partial [Pseudomonas syringae group genomosp. 7]|uniref:hypothetical protein n=1 Tax=Pseudomonas syringae group genomosp. 7 TaxID=251699 RepID=UPI00376FA291
DYRHLPYIEAAATPDKVLWCCEQIRRNSAARSASSARAEPVVVALPTEGAGLLVKASVGNDADIEPI